MSIAKHKRRDCPKCGKPNALTTHDATQCAECYHGRRVAVPSIETPENDGPPFSQLFDDRWAVFQQWIGRTKASTRGPSKAVGLPRRVITHSTDWHIPHMNWDAFYAWVEATKDADICVVGGDTLNAGAVSRFVEGAFTTPQEEFAQLTQALQICAETWPEVHVNLGNHPERFRKFFGARLPPYVMFLVQCNPIQFVIEGLRREHGVNNLHLAKPLVLDLEASSFGTPIGDCVFTHGETHSKVKMRPAENVARWMRRWDRFLPVRPRVIVQEHNHHGGGPSFDQETGCWLFQAPCFSHNVNYQVDARMCYGPNMAGWTRIVQENEQTVINESRFYVFDAKDGKVA